MNTLSTTTLYFILIFSLVSTYPAVNNVEGLDKIGNGLKTVKSNGHRNSRLGSKHFRHWSSFNHVPEKQNPDPRDSENDMSSKDSEDSELDANLDAFLAWSKTAPKDPKILRSRMSLPLPMVQTKMEDTENMNADYCLTCIPPRSCPSGTVRSHNGRCVPTADW